MSYVGEDERREFGNGQQQTARPLRLELDGIAMQIETDLRQENSKRRVKKGLELVWVIDVCDDGVYEFLGKTHRRSDGRDWS